MLNGLEKDVRKRILEKLKYMEELPTEEMGDLSFELWETENVNGTVTHSTQESKKWIAKHFDDIGEVLENLEDCINPEKNGHSAFVDPDGFMVCICIEVTSTLLYKAENNGEEMTVKRLKKALKSL